MPIKDMATSTATFGFIRYVEGLLIHGLHSLVYLRLLGGSLGIAIGQAIWSSVSLTVYQRWRFWFLTSKQFLQKSLKTIPGITFNSSAGALSQSVKQLKNIPVRIACYCSASRQRDGDNRIRLLEMLLYTRMGAQSAKYGWSTHRFARLDLS